MPANFVMVSAQFENTDGTDIPLMDINFGDDFKGPMWSAEASDYESVAPHVQLTSATFEISGKYWFVDEGREDPQNPGSYIPGWVDMNGNEIDKSVKVTAGRGLWYRDGYNANPFYGLAGQVVNDSPIARTFGEGFRMLACPYPQSVRLSDIKFIGIDENLPVWDPDATYEATATQIQVPYEGEERTQKLWYVDEGREDPKNPGTYIPGWVDMNGNEVDPTQIVLPIGRACWFRPLVGGNSISVEFTK